MRHSSLKPRWLSWENLCLKVAFEQKIQLKIIAAALEKSVTSVSKKIRKLGLREERSTEERSRPGRLKGDIYFPNWEERIPLDFEKMAEIISQYAPLKHSQKLQLASRACCWTTASAASLHTASHLGHSHNKKPYYSLSFSAPFLEKEAAKTFNKPLLSREPLYVSLCHIEKWALSKGFHPVKNVLRAQGLSYWKEGKYFSKAQLLVYVNGIRLEKKLQPLHLYEEETDP